MSEENSYVFDQRELEWLDIEVDKRPWIRVNYYNVAIIGLHVKSIFNAIDVDEVNKRCPNLRRLTTDKISWNIFQNPLVKNVFRKLKKLRINSFSDNKVRNTSRRILKILATCSDLEELHLPGARCSKVFLQAKYTNLKSISLAIDSEEDFVTRFFQRHECLEWVFLTGNAASIIPLLPHVKVLVLMNCSFEWTPSFGHLKQLTSLRIENRCETIDQLCRIPFDDYNLIDISGLPNLKSFFLFQPSVQYYVAWTRLAGEEIQRT